MDDIIEASTLSIEEWEKLLFSPESINMLPNCCFPTEKICDAYLSTVDMRSDDDVRRVLRRFLIHSGNLGIDKYNLESTKGWDVEKLCERKNKSEYFRRLVTPNENTWEGITWVLDLLPHDPLQAIRVVDSYWYAHCQALPDFRLQGLSDSILIIRRKYCDKVHPQEILLSLTAQEFEWLIEALYSAMGYTTSLTKRSYDGGVDVIAKNSAHGKKEEILIQCKRHQNTIGVSDVRELMGVVSDQKSTKGVLVCSSGFSPEAKKFSETNSRIELIDRVPLMKLLNQHLGAKWQEQMERIFHEKRRNSE